MAEALIRRVWRLRERRKNYGEVEERRSSTYCQNYCGGDGSCCRASPMAGLAAATVGSARQTQPLEL